MPKRRGDNRGRPQEYNDPAEEPPERLGRRDTRDYLEYIRRTIHFVAFDKKIVNALLGNLKVVLIGDSLMRGLYKDLVSWVQHDSLSDDREIKVKCENSYRGDRLVDSTMLDADKVFRQVRQYQSDIVSLQFFFTTRVMKDDLETLLMQMKNVDGYPDVIFLNSAIWDLTRYCHLSNTMPYMQTEHQKRIEVDSLEKFLDRTSMLLRRFRAILPSHTMVVWICFPHCRPSSMQSGGMMNLPLVKERNHLIRGLMIDGSYRIAQVVRQAGYDVIDLDFYFRNHAMYHYQKQDGMHWHPAGLRLQSQLVMQFLAKSWGIDLSDEINRLASVNNLYYLKEADILLKNYEHLDSYHPESLQQDIARKTMEELPPDVCYRVKKVIALGRTLIPLSDKLGKRSKPSDNLPRVSRVFPSGYNSDVDHELWKRRRKEKRRRGEKIGRRSRSCDLKPKGLINKVNHDIVRNMTSQLDAMCCIQEDWVRIRKL